MGITLALLLTAQSFPEQLTGFDRRWEEIKRQASPRELYGILWALPKGGDLHNHHEYSVPMRRWLELAIEKKRLYYTRLRTSVCPGEETPLAFYTVRSSTYESLPACVRADYQRLDLLTAEQRRQWVSAMELDQPGEARDELFERIVRRLGEMERDPELMTELLFEQMRQAKSENTLYLEPQFDPRGFRHPSGARMGEDKAAAFVRERLRAAGDTGVTMRFQVSELRFLDDTEKELANAFDFVHRHSDLWKAVNLVGREDHPLGAARRFANTFRDLRRRYFNVHLALHGGESDMPGRQVRDTLLLGAERIGHGVNLASDPETMLWLRGNRSFLIEINLVSNYLLDYTPDLARHPLPEYLRLGIPVCLNTDDRGAYRSNLTDDYFLAVRHFNLSWQEVVQLGRNSLLHAFVEEPVKSRLLTTYEQRVQAFAIRYSAANWRSLPSAATPSAFAREKLLRD